MGGFIYVDGKHESVLDFDAFRRLPGISFPTISSAEICDKARGDFLLKAIAILQSLWFIIQCVARSKQGLALTELELLTLALGSLNGVMYFFWWDKPLGVNEPVKLYPNGREPPKTFIEGGRQEHLVSNHHFPQNVLSTYWTSRNAVSSRGSSTYLRVFARFSSPVVPPPIAKFPPSSH